nr:hypothetical protein [Erythrobacter sp. YJ-T3-07]
MRCLYQPDACQRLLACSAALFLASCSEAAPPPSSEATAGDLAAIPDSLSPFGDGYPNAGDPCRRLGESAATSRYLDHTAILVGCPSDRSASAVGGEIVATIDGVIDGVRIVSIPAEGAMAGSGVGPEADAALASTQDDPLVDGTPYNATAAIRCGLDGDAPVSNCDAGVRRNWNGPGTALVEITKPDGRKRAIFFEDGVAFSAESAQSDGWAAYDFQAVRNEDQTTVRFGPETYVIVDALVRGG